MGNEGSFPKSKAAGHKVGLSPAVSADVKNKGISNLVSLVRVCLQNTGMGTMTWYLYTNNYIQQDPSWEVVYCLVKPVFFYLFREPTDTWPPTQNLATRTLSYRR